MELNQIDEILARLESEKTNGRDHILSLSRALIEWMGFVYVENNRPRLLDFKTLKLKEALVPAPITGQEQIYRMTAEGQNLRVRFAVLKKFDKKVVQYLVDTNVGLTSYQAGMRGIKQIEGREPYVSSQPYFVHFITTAKYDRLWVVFNDEGEQKRILMFRNKLSQTQFHKILPVWQNIAAKPKPEMAKLFWSSLDVKEVNKEFYRQVKDQFDSLIGKAKAQKPDVDEAMAKQFAVRLIGRYIFCWFLKEKEVIPELLVASKTIERYKDTYFQTLLTKLFFKTLNAEVTDKARNETITELDELYKNIPYLNGGLFDWHPEDVLFNQIDLNDWLIAFVQVLERFDFTVDESSSTYQHVAIDPEMLGRIFENLLASQNPDTEKMANQRKAYGAFYTPREIVDYMVNESLKAYLETRLMPMLPEPANAVAEPAAVYTGLFESLKTNVVAEPGSRTLLADIENKRERMKERIAKLFAPECSDNPFDKEETILARKALSEITVLDPACGSGAFPMGVMLRLMELRQIVGHGHRNSYDLKEEILSRNIFGVDIMPMAVEIARLRAWLSLVLEADYKPNDRKNNFGIAALPNLDFKFVCANSLIDSGYDDFLGKIHLNATLFRLDGEIQKLERIRSDYFDPKGDKERKKELQTEFEYTKEYIKAQLNQGSLRKSYNLDDFFNKVDDWNPFDDSHPSSFFSPAWMFGIRNGFDVVIGNPPYGAKLLADEIELFKKTYDLKSSETAILFIEKGIKILSSKGIQCYIIPKSFTFASNYDFTRDYIENGLSIIVDCGKAFDEVKLEACIFQFKNGVLLPSYISLRFTENSTFERLSVIDKSLKREFGFYPNGLTEIEILIGRKIFKAGIFLKDIATNSRGCLLQDNLEEKGDIKVIGGKQIDRYGIRSVKGFIKSGTHLADKCKIKQNSLLAQNIVAHLIYPVNHIKIISCLPYIITNYAITDTINQIVTKDNRYSTEFIWSLFSSTLINWYVYLFIYGKAIRTMHFDNTVTDRIPIPIIQHHHHQLFISWVEKILSAKVQNLDTTDLEKKIDVLVYKLYELTYEEVKVVDKDFWLSKEEYQLTDN